MKSIFKILLSALFVAVLVGIYIYRHPAKFISNSGRNTMVVQWIRNPESHPEWAVKAKSVCNQSVFLFPTDGFIGFLWGDSFRPGHQHQGIDIFGGEEPGIVPIYAAYDGYLTRLSNWKSTVIIRIPEDPLNPEQQIWTYYTHMANPQGESSIEADFPPGTYEKFVEAGTLLGYQGNYSGTPGNPTGVHLHFSIVKDDGSGKFLNELEIKNTIDPSPYFNLELNSKTNKGEIPICQSN